MPPMRRTGPKEQRDKVDNLFAGIILLDAIRRGVGQQELINLAVRYKCLDVVQRLLERTP